MASFELGLISDRAANVVHRMDTVTGAYLGSFGQNFLNAPGGVVLDQANNTAYVADTNRVTLWNYNTGDYLGTFATGGGVVTSFSRNPQDGSFNITTFNGVRRFSSAGVLIRTYTATGGLPYQCGLLANDGNYYVSANGGGAFRLEWQNPATGALVGGTNWAADRYIPTVGNTYINLFTVGSANVVERDTLNNAVGGVTVANSSGQVSLTGGAFGHNGLLYVVGKSSANPAVGAIRKVDMTAGTFGNLYGQGFLVDPSGIAIVVAPEPGSLGVLALGAAWMLRRRRG